MKIEMYDIDVKNKNWTLIQQVRKIWEEVREVEQALILKDTNNFFEECNDVKQTIHTLEKLYCKIKSISEERIIEENKRHIEKMKSREK